MDITKPIEVVKDQTHIVVPSEPTEPRRLFLSNIDLTLAVYLETLTFFHSKPSPDPFDEVVKVLTESLGRLLVSYDFMAGRLAVGSNGRLEVECNSAGGVVATATASCSLEFLRQCDDPKPIYAKLVQFLQEYIRGKKLEERPLLLLQLTRFECGGLALGCLYNHCTLDGVGILHLSINHASLSRGGTLIIPPDANRIPLASRSPPSILFPHHEYSTSTLPTSFPSAFSSSSSSPTTPPVADPSLVTKSFTITRAEIDRIKSAVLSTGHVSHASDFHVLVAMIWRARVKATGISDRTSTVLFPLDIRKRMIPPLPVGFAGNGVFPGFATATLEEMSEASSIEVMAVCVKKVQDGLGRVDDEYVRSAIDWLEVNRGGSQRVVDSFSVVAWMKLGLEECEYSWGKVDYVLPMEVKPGLVLLLPGGTGNGGKAGKNAWVDVRLALSETEMEVFFNAMKEY